MRERPIYEAWARAAAWKLAGDGRALGALLYVGQASHEKVYTDQVSGGSRSLLGQLD